MDQVRRYIAFLQEYSIPLILGVVAGLVGPTSTSPAITSPWSSTSGISARALSWNRHPAVNFLLLLAVADDAIGLVAIIAVFYSCGELRCIRSGCC